jgi:hypothetical protein
LVVGDRGQALPDAAVAVRDTKNWKGDVLAFGPEAFREFVENVKQGC